MIPVTLSIAERRFLVQALTGYDRYVGILTAEGLVEKHDYRATRDTITELQERMLSLSDDSPVVETAHSISVQNDAPIPTDKQQFRADSVKGISGTLRPQLRYRPPFPGTILLPFSAITQKGTAKIPVSPLVALLLSSHARQAIATIEAYITDVTTYPDWYSEYARDKALNYLPEKIVNPVKNYIGPQSQPHLNDKALYEIVVMKAITIASIIETRSYRFDEVNALVGNTQAVSVYNRHPTIVDDLLETINEFYRNREKLIKGSH